MRFAATALLGFMACAQQKPTPKISDAARAKLWKAVADLQTAQMKLNAAQAVFKEAQDLISKECAGSFMLDEAGEPQCSPAKNKEVKK